MIKTNLVAALLIITFVFVKLKTAVPYLEYDSRIIVDLQHAIDVDDCTKFSNRGNITIISLNSGLTSVVQSPLTLDEQHAIIKMAARNEFYRVKATILYPEGKARVLFTSSKACALLNAQLKDEFSITIDGSGFVNAVTHTSARNKLNTLDCHKEVPKSLLVKEFNTDVVIKHTELAPVPDTASYIQKLEREREAREKGETKDTRGFFAKYWMYIVPVVLIVFISGAANPDQAK